MFKKVQSIQDQCFFLVKKEVLENTRDKEVDKSSAKDLADK